MRTVVVVVVVDSLEHELEEEYPDGETGSGVRLRGDTGGGDVRWSISSRRLRSFAGVGGLFLTGLKDGSLYSWTGSNVFCFRNSCRSRSDSMASSISRRRSCSYYRISIKSAKSL